MVEKMLLKRRDFVISLAALMGGCATKINSIPEQAFPQDVMNDELIADVHRRTFNFFWETCDDERGLTPDRYPTRMFCSIAAVGFALTAYCIGVKRNYVSREDGAKRTLNTLKFLYNAPQGDAPSGMAGHKGFFYHFLNYSDGTRFKNCELSSIDTTLFIYGALVAKEFFDKNEKIENEIRDYAQKLYERIDWGFLTNQNGLLGMGWHPETGYIKALWEGYSEGILCYLLGMASPTYPIDASAWDKWCSTYDLTWGKNMGTQEHVGYFSLSVHQLPHIWYDLRDIADKYMKKRGLTYFENTRRATLTQRTYAINNPQKFNDYGENIWGFAACDGPYDGKLNIDGKERFFRSYSERGPGTRAMFDDGTIAPTSSISSMPLTPNESIAALKALRAKYGDDIYGKYGFFDSFNPTYKGNYPSQFGRQTKNAGWVTYDYLGIDQGPIIAMIENHSSGFVRDLMKGSVVIKTGLQKAGFEPINANGNWMK